MKNNVFNQIFPLVWHSMLGAVILLAVWLIIYHLPMLDGIPFPFSFGLKDVLGALVLSWMVVGLVNFAFRLEVRLDFRAPQYKPVGLIVKLAVFLIADLVLYLAYRPLALPYMGQLSWVYHLLFLLGFLALLAMLAYILFANLGKLFPDSEIAAPEKINALYCRKCGGTNRTGTVYCAFCGYKIASPARKCSCGIDLIPGAKFCPGCGSPAVGVADETAAAADAVCVSCQEPLQAGARFCPSCGAEQV